MQCCFQINGKTTCIGFANNCIQMFNQFTLYKLTDWGYIRNIFHTHFTPLWWIKMSPPQASPVSSLCTVLCGCLISSSQTAWENSGAAVTLSPFNSAPWGTALEMRMGMLLWRQRDQSSLMCHLHRVTFLHLYSIITWGLVVNMAKLHWWLDFMILEIFFQSHGPLILYQRASLVCLHLCRVKE